jgi:hypothetical protein
LFDGKLFQFIAPGARVPVEITVLRPLNATIERDQIPHDELSHAPTS